MTDYEVIIPAAGSGKRMGAGFNKLFLELNKRPVIAFTAEVFLADPSCKKLILPVQPHDLEEMKRILPRSEKIVFARGGSERQYSVRNGLELAGSCSVILVHDGARPFISTGFIAALAAMAGEKGAAIAAVPVKDTIKRAKDQIVTETIERSSLWQIQTPQAFRTSVLKNAHKAAERDGFLGTDEASLVERIGHAVHIVPGSYDNIKITTPEDLYFAEAILKKQGGG